MLPAKKNGMINIRHEESESINLCQVLRSFYMTVCKKLIPET
jgi:hypothetical protein